MNFANFHLIINFWTSIIHANNTFIDDDGERRLGNRGDVRVHELAKIEKLSIGL